MKKEFSFRIINRKSSGNNFEKISLRLTFIDLELPSIEDVEVLPPPLAIHLHLAGQPRHAVVPPHYIQYWDWGIESF